MMHWQSTMRYDLLGSVLQSYGWTLPAMIAWGVGIVLALVRWRTHPRISAFALIGFGVMLLKLLVMTPLYLYLPRALVRGGSYAAWNAVLMALHLLDTLITAACFALIIAAIFCYRAAQQPQPDASLVQPDQPAA
jgi:multisubunit Na+/H+ antiporter MnhB subunit